MKKTAYLSPLIEVVTVNSGNNIMKGSFTMCSDNVDDDVPQMLPGDVYSW